MKNHFKLLLAIFISTLLLVGLIWADSNGVWHNAEDVRGGTFALDEMGVTSYFRFLHPVYFENSAHVNGSLTVNGNNVATLDVMGKVPIEQLPFHKGDVISPANRPLISGLSGYTISYFDITNLGISGFSASNIKAGTSFGPSNMLVGSYTQDGTALSSDIRSPKTAYVNGVKLTGALTADSICSSAGGTASCGASSSLMVPGTYYTIIGANSPTGTNYCNKLDVFSNGIVTSTIVKNAGVCKLISSCSSSSQSIANYPDTTSCGGSNLCVSGNCVTSSTYSFGTLNSYLDYSMRIKIKLISINSGRYYYSWVTQTQNYPSGVWCNGVGDDHPFTVHSGGFSVVSPDNLKYSGTSKEGVVMLGLTSVGDERVIGMLDDPLPSHSMKTFVIKFDGYSIVSWTPSSYPVSNNC